MGKRKVMNIQWPEAGLMRDTPYQTQPPYSTPECLNVRPDSTIGAGRARGGSRPGLSRAFYTQLGSGNPVRMLAQCTVVKEDKSTYVMDMFGGSTLGSQWSAASWLGTAPSISEDLISVSYATGAVGAVREAISDIDTAQVYTARIYIVPFAADHHGKYQIFAFMNNSTPVATTDGIVAELVLESATGALSGTLKDYSGGALIATYAFTDPAVDASAQPGWFEVQMSGTSVVCKWRGSTVRAATTVTAGVGSRVGFGINCTQAGGICLVDTFRVDYVSTANLSEHKTHLVASSNGSVYQDNSPNTLETISLSSTLASDRLIHAGEYGGKLYIGDHGNYLVKVTDGVRGTGNDRLDSATVADWTSKGLSIYDHVAVVTNATGDLINGVYKITTIASGELTLAANWATGAAGTATVRIERGPKVYDPVAKTMVLLDESSGNGDIPIGCPICCIYRGRLVLAGAAVNPHLWWMSKQDALQDFDFTVDASNAQRAIQGSTNDAGKIGKPLVGAIQSGDDYLIFCCRDEMWILRGDPGFGGSMDNLSRIIGLVDKGAWCWGPAGEIIFLSLDGLYIMPSGGGIPVRLSRERLPEELTEIDPNQYEVLMQYDVAEEGVHIFLSGRSKSDRLHWWLDWNKKSFWPVDLIDNHEPFAIMALSARDATQRSVILGCRDGYLRSFSGLNEDDDGTVITSYVLLGPVGIAGTDYLDGRTKEVIATLGANSGNVGWKMYRASTHEGVITAFNAASSHFAEGTFTAGLNRKARPIGRGRAFGLRLAAVTDRRAWDIDSLAIVVESSGRQRVY